MLKKIALFVVFLAVLALPALAEADETVVKFVQMSDVHISNATKDSSSRMFKYSKDLLADAIKQVNNMKEAEFIIYTGDMVDGASIENLKQFIELANKSYKPWYPVLGNHDTAVGVPNYKNNVVSLMKSKTAGMKNGKTYYSFSPNPRTKVIVLDVTTDQKITNHGYIPEEQRNWLKKELENSKDKVVIIATHHPVIPPFKGSDHTIAEPDASLTLGIINQYPNVALILGGHYHSAKLFKNSGKVHACAPAMIQYPNAFRLITIKENGDINFEWKETGLKEVQAKSKSRLKSIGAYAGQAADRVNTLNYKY